MHKLAACFATSMSGVTEVKKLPKFPPKPVKKPVSAKASTEDTLKRYPRIMAELAK